MSMKHSWLWKIYLVIMLSFVVTKTYDLFAQDSQSSLYYFILRAFEPHFYTIYVAHVIQVILSIVHLVSLYLFIYRIRFLPADLWKGLFVLRCLFEVTGHSFEVNSLVALYHRKPRIFWTVLLIVTVPHIPSYLACYWYAFRREKVLSLTTPPAPA